MNINKNKNGTRIGYVLFTILVLVPLCFARAEDALNDLMKKYGNKKTQENQAEAPKTSPPKVTKQEETKKEKPKQSSNENSKENIKNLSKDSVNVKVARRGPHPHTIQLASFEQEYEALVRTQELTKMGYNVFYKKAEVKDKVWYRVFLGSFESRAAAQEYLDTKFANPLKATAVIVRTQKDEPDKIIPSIASPVPAVVTPLVVEKDQAPKEIPKESAKQSPKENAKESARESDKESAEATSESSEEPNGLFGNWFGLKSGMKNHGVRVQIKYKGDAVKNIEGGLEQKSDYLGNLDVIAEFNLEKILGLNGLDLLLYGMGDHGGKPTEYIGDSYGTSNIQAPSTFKLYEAYFKKAFDERFTTILGFRDLNADYYSTSSSGTLINSAFGIGPSFSQTGVNGPSIFPNTSLALTVKYESPKSFYFQTGLFNAKAGDPEKKEGTNLNTDHLEGYIYISEFGFSSGEGSEYYKYAVGSWAYSKLKAALDTAKPESQNSGTYLLLEKNLTKIISLFIKHGNATPEVNRFRSSTETGIGFQGLISSRPQDRLTFGFARTVLSDDYKAVNSIEKDESAAELNYRMEMNNGIAVTPDLQYVTNPGSASDVKNAYVGILRLEIQF